MAVYISNSIQEVNDMLYRGLLKRFLPFFLTFAVGLFIASFFMAISSPSFNFRRSGTHKHREIQRLRIENKELRMDVLRMKRELEEARRNSFDVTFPVEEVPPFEMDVPLPPQTKAPRYGR